MTYMLQKALADLARCAAGYLLTRHEGVLFYAKQLGLEDVKE